jgi:DNA-binding IclR family transcriptional regulator
VGVEAGRSGLRCRAVDDDSGIPESVIGRIGLVLNAFGPDDADLGLTELARRSGIAKPTVHRLAAQLVEAGFLERLESRYRLGVRLFELGQRVPSSRRLREAALPFMEDLYVATRETVHLAVPDGIEVMYLEKISGHRPVDAPSRIAGRMPMYCTATGKAMLAHSSEEVVERVLGGVLARRTPYTQTVPDVMRGELIEIRKSGVAVEREETRLGYVSVAAPLFGRRNTLVGAMSVTGPAYRTQLDSLSAIVRTAGRALSRVLESTHP